MHAPTAALRFDAAGQAGCIHVPAVGLQLHQRHLARNHHRELAGEMPGMPSSLPISDDPGGITLYVGGHLVLLELLACFLLRRIAETSMKDVIDALLLATTYHYRAHVHFNSQNLDRSQRSRHFLCPGSAFAGDSGFLRLALGKKA